VNEDGNTLADSGPVSTPAAPPSSASSGGSSDLEQARGALSDLDAQLARNDYDDDGEKPVDLDQPQYPATDARAKLSRLADIAEQSAPQAAPELAPPRSWTKEDIAIFKSLPPETQQRIVENERSREQHWNNQRVAIDRARHEAIAAAESKLQPELDRVRHLQEVARLPIELAQQVQQRDAAEKEFRSRYPDLTNAEFADQYHQRLYAQDPAKAEQFVSDINELAKVAQDTERIAFLHQQEAAKQEVEAQRARGEQLKQFQASQDAEFARRNPDFADEHKAAEIREKAVIPYLRDALKLSPERIAHLWANEPLFRTVESQQLLLDGARWHAAQQAARAAAPKVAAKPQSGGVNQGYVRGDELASAAHTGNMERYVALRNGGRSR
jgi:uncharacterized small protein (DUF1192 family)